jgi:hypothetical protein
VQQLERHTLEKRLLEKDIKYAYRDHISVKPQNDGFIFKELTQDMAERSVEYVGHMAGRTVFASNPP